MYNNPTLKKDACRHRSSEKQAIRESLAPFAPFPGALEQDGDAESRQIRLKVAKKRRH